MKTCTSFWLILLFLASFTSSCRHDKKFNKEKWLACNDVNDTSNPRAYMTDDLIQNYLKRGMPKDSILALLGKPYEDGVVPRLPKGLNVPDSISIISPENMKPENSDKALKRFNEFMRVNNQPDTLMLYPAGWSTIDPNFLVIELDHKGKVKDFRVEQH